MDDWFSFFFFQLFVGIVSFFVWYTSKLIYEICNNNCGFGIGCLTSDSTIFQWYIWRHIDVQADWIRSWTYGRAPNAIDIPYGFLMFLSKHWHWTTLFTVLHDILDDDHIQWHPPLIGHYTNFWPLLIWTILPNLTFYLIVQGFHRTYATGAASQQRTLTPPDTWSCPTLGLACVLMSRPISPELVLSPDFWISNIPWSFHLEYPLVLSRFYLL